MPAMLTAEHVSGGYGERRVLHDVSIRVLEGERLLLIGPNGCGKTTLLKVLAGTLKPDSGRIVFQGRDILQVPGYLRMRMGLGYLMQTRNVFRSLTVDENLHLSFWHRNGHYESQRDRLLDVFSLLKGKLGRRAGLLSGGERQALAVCMVMIRPVRLLLLDEPTAGLAPKAAEDILRAIQQAQKTLGFASIMVEHNLRLVSPWVSRVLVMKQGRIVGEEGDPARLLDQEILQRYYFG